MGKVPVYTVSELVADTGWIAPDPARPTRHSALARCPTACGLAVGDRACCRLHRLAGCPPGRQLCRAFWPCPSAAAGRMMRHQ